MRNPEWRNATDEDLQEGTVVYCFYLGPDPDRRTIGTVKRRMDDGWHAVHTTLGQRHYFNAERLAVKR